MKRHMFLVLVLLSLVLSSVACGESPAPAEPPREDTAVQEQQALTDEASTQAREAASQYGFSIEVEGLLERIVRTNDPARVEWVYVVSPYTGEIIFKATVVGKVTSTTKRLDTPQSYDMHEFKYWGTYYYEWFEFERIGPDGAYGPSTPGIFWFDTAGLMHQLRGIESALIFELERPYVFENNRVDLMVDIRQQATQYDQELYQQALRVADYIHAHPEWRPGDEIPIEVLSGQ